jgi:peptide chain release factor 1
MNEKEILSKLGAIKDHYLEVGKKIIDPEVISDTKRYVKFSKEYKELEPVADAFDSYKLLYENIENAKEIIQSESDADFKDMAKEELNELLAEKEKMEEDIKVLLIPKDPEDSKNAVVEIRGGTGGDEAAIFAGDLFRVIFLVPIRTRWVQ